MKTQSAYFENRNKIEGRSLKQDAVVRCRFGFRLLTWLFFLIAIVARTGLCQEVEPDHLFRVAFSSALVRDVNGNDARAALKAWAESITQEGAVSVNPDVLFCDESKAMVEALHNRTADGLATTMKEYFSFRDKVKFNRYIFSVVNGSIFEQYVLLVHVKSGISRIEDLRGRSIKVLQAPPMDLALPWLDTLLMEKGLKPASDFCGSIEKDVKLMKTVLSVFFRNADACLATVKGFKTMSELNPQVGRQLRVLAMSQEMVTGAFFLRVGYPQRMQDQFVSEIAKIHVNPSGQQALMVFQIERMEEHPASVMDSAIALLEAHCRLSGGTNCSRAVYPDAAVRWSKADGVQPHVLKQ